MKKITFLFIFLSHLTFAQSKSETDSLTLLLPSMAEDTNKVWAYEKITAFCYVNKPVLAKDYAQKGIALAREIQFKKGEVMCLLRLGQIHQQEANFVTAYDYFIKALDLAEKIQYKQGYRRLLGQLTSIYRNLGDFECIKHN